MDRPNAVWTADFKGQFRTGDGRYCYPLTVQDGASRFLLTCRGLPEPTTEASAPVFRRLFQRYGLPERMRGGCRRASPRSSIRGTSSGGA